MATPSVARYVLRGTGVGLLAGFGITGCAALNEMQTREYTPAEALERLDQTEAGLLEAQDARLETEVSIGEVCLRAMRPYTGDGVLSDTPEDTVVADLLAEPGTPCGDTPREARTTYRSFVVAGDDILSAEQNVDRWRLKLEKAEQQVQDATKPEAILINSLLLGAVGAFFGGTLFNLDNERKAKSGDSE